MKVGILQSIVSEMMARMQREGASASAPGDGPSAIGRAAPAVKLSADAPQNHFLQAALRAVQEQATPSAPTGIELAGGSLAQGLPTGPALGVQAPASWGHPTEQTFDAIALVIASTGQSTVVQIGSEQLVLDGPLNEPAGTLLALRLVATPNAWVAQKIESPQAPSCHPLAHIAPGASEPAAPNAGKTAGLHAPVGRWTPRSAPPAGAAAPGVKHPYAAIMPGPAEPAPSDTPPISQADPSPPQAASDPFAALTDSLISLWKNAVAKPVTTPAPAASSPPSAEHAPEGQAATAAVTDPVSAPAIEKPVEFPAGSSGPAEPAQTPSASPPDQAVPVRADSAPPPVGPVQRPADPAQAPAEPAQSPRLGPAGLPSLPFDVEASAVVTDRVDAGHVRLEVAGRSLVVEAPPDVHPGLLLTVRRSAQTPETLDILQATDEPARAATDILHRQAPGPPAQANRVLPDLLYRLLLLRQEPSDPVDPEAIAGALSALRKATPRLNHLTPELLAQAVRSGGTSLESILAGTIGRAGSDADQAVVPDSLDADLKAALLRLQAALPEASADVRIQELSQMVGEQLGAIQAQQAANVLAMQDQSAYLINLPLWVGQQLMTVGLAVRPDTSSTAGPPADALRGCSLLVMLDSPQLGRICIDGYLTDSRLDARFYLEQPTTLDRIRETLPSLRGQLLSMGYREVSLACDLLGTMPHETRCQLDALSTGVPATTGFVDIRK